MKDAHFFLKYLLLHIHYQCKHLIKFAAHVMRQDTPWRYFYIHSTLVPPSVWNREPAPRRAVDINRAGLGGFCGVSWAPIRRNTP